MSLQGNILDVVYAMAKHSLKADSQFLSNYVFNKLGFCEENIIVLGRLVGTRIAEELMQEVKPGALAPISLLLALNLSRENSLDFLGYSLPKKTTIIEQT